ncbi:glycosyl transferase [Herbaspirillum lusitanum]|uniref:glycosyltransferase family 4 protein n=1 Tax=Herbaspirillum lusitanum TaxID=213312 RepID=UPI0022380C07|nr:glycosyltransferase [Herbaspirillum lusitanum]MCW5296919.1 glycosyl transferase [Herbaspirillum lusitanum]
MSSFLISFVVSAILTLLVIRHAHFHEAGLDVDLDGVQKVHAHAVPRIGGLCIFATVIISSAISVFRANQLGSEIGLLLICSSVAFVGGIVEDFTRKVSPTRRLGLTLIAAILGYFLLDARIQHLHWGYGEWIIQSMWITLPLTVFAVAGVAHAVNIIDGFNGLASVVTICMLLSLGYVALQVNDVFVLVVALMVAGATAGFFIWNFPAGMIFLGDGGAYFLGFILGELSILLVMRNPEVSSWYALLLLIYPVFETLFSAYRRVFLRGKSPGMPDGIHLHSLIFRRIVLWAVGRKDARALTRRNSMTSPYLWILSLMAVVPATLFWRHTGALMACSLVFIATYLWLYARIVRFKSPRWMILTKKK